MTWYTDTIQKDLRFNSALACRDTALLFPTFLARVEEALSKLAELGQSFEIVETYRSQERQEELFREGATELRQVGVHHFGLACDCVRLIGGAANWQPGVYVEYGQQMQAAGLVWGGSWATLKDLVHVQMISVEDQSKLFSGSWYPDESYTTGAS